MALALISIFAIAGAAWALRRLTKIRICPICAGVAGTWIWMLTGILLDLLPTARYLLLVATLMGGSIVGVAYQLEKRLPEDRSPLFWKMLFIPAGFLAVWSILEKSWLTLIAAGLIITFVAIVCFTDRRKKNYPRSPIEPDQTVEKIKKEMEKCC